MTTETSLSDTNARLVAILNADDLGFGVAFNEEGSRVLIEGGGDAARMAPSAARRILDLLTTEWGENDLQVFLLKASIEVVEAGE